jgi:hypothetical protein
MNTAPAILTWLSTQPFALWIAESQGGFPIIEIVHVFALCVVVGSIAMVDLRLLYLAGHKRRVSELSSAVLPWTWGAFGAAVVAGFFLFSSKAPDYYANPAFRFKFVCLLLAGVNMVTYQLFTLRGLPKWDQGPTPWPVRAAGAFSLCLWILVVAGGRWTGFIGR